VQEDIQCPVPLGISLVFLGIICNAAFIIFERSEIFGWFERDLLLNSALYLDRHFFF